MKPPRSILDKEFSYIGSARTDLAATFRRIRKQIAEDLKKQESSNVKPLTKRKEQA